MRQGQLNNVTYLKQRRKDLRNNSTAAEAVLWKALKGSALKNRKFRRQHSIENYIVDFYCPEEKLAIELDGGIHDDPIQSANDEERTKRLNELGCRVIRFKNSEVFADIVSVLFAIEAEFGASEQRE
jgi:very-short-patch-repair endonuclease